MPVRVFFSYSHVDEGLRDAVETQLAMLKRQGVIEAWHDRRIGAGEDFAAAIDAHVESAEVILLLVSPDFLASDYCYDVEMRRAMDRHEAGEATVVPVILRPCDWKPAPFGKLNATPRDGKPVTRWADRDEALLQVATAVRAAAERFGPAPATASPAALRAPRPDGSASPRSSNLTLAKSFTERDRDRFKRDSFEFIARFFETSLEELAARNVGVEADFRRVDADRFAATIYRDGEAAAKCSVFVGDGVVGRGIAYSSSDHFGGGFNELLTVESDDQAVYLRSLGMSTLSSADGKRARLTQEGAAELYWELLIQPLQPARR